jgi:pantoate--beta-alanine ligase
MHTPNVLAGTGSCQAAMSLAASMLVVVQVHTTIESLRTALRGCGDVGFVPTMGALHAGHVSLMNRARAENNVVVASIFVNPLQFGLSDDFTRYPRPLDVDCEKAEAAGVDHLFAPTADEMYPNGPVLTCVHVPDITETLEGAIRPGHFDGVTTVVAKLFAIVQPQRAYFGEKDWQQLEVVRQMSADLSLPVEIVPCPIVRESDGLAMSSRNVYLSDEERVAAGVLNKALLLAVNEIESGCREPSEISALMMSTMSARKLVEPDYAAVVTTKMRWPERINSDVRLLVAARVGTTRLVDNVGVAVA